MNVIRNAPLCIAIANALLLLVLFALYASGVGDRIYDWAYPGPDATLSFFGTNWKQTVVTGVGNCSRFGG